MPIHRKKFTPELYLIEYIVDETETGSRLDQYLLKYLFNYSRQEIKKFIQTDNVKIKDRPGKHKPNTKVYTGDIITLYRHKTSHEDEYWNGQKLELQTVPEIVYQDDELFVISKPAFMTTHPTGVHLFNCATVYLEQFNDDKTVHSIHRLDRETSGILLLGRNPKVSNQLTEEFEKKNVQKCYMFIAMKTPSYNGEKEFRCDLRLGTSEKGIKRVYINAYPENSREGKHASTDFRILFDDGKYVIGLAFPKTGRQHQIRVHARANGLPLIGDKLYLGGYEMFQRFKDQYATQEDHELMQLPRHALHALGIRIRYKGEPKIFQTHIPEDFKEWMRKNLFLDISNFEFELHEKVEEYLKLIK